MSEQRRLGGAEARLGRLAGGIGLSLLLAAVGLAAVTHDGWQRFFFAYLVGYAFVLTVVLGALFFVILQHLTRAGWSVVLRRLAEGVMSAMPAMAVLAIPVLVGIPHLYHWSHAAEVAADPVLVAKSAYLNAPFFVLRVLAYLAIWVLISRYFLRASVQQDTSHAPRLSLQMQRHAAWTMVVFALSTTFASFDLLMSLDAHWYSTIFGVYIFSGAALGSLAVLTLVAFAVQRAGYLRSSITLEHFHDLGKLVFAFVVFWAYIAFSQYMLYWYGNIPAETGWFVRRQEHGWEWVGVVLIVGHFLLPFLLLLSRLPKRRPRILAAVAGWVVLMHWVDVYWLVVPEVSPGGPMPTLVDLLLWFGLTAVTAAVILHRMHRHALIPEGDPRLAESQTFENA
jgi:hypothetical protein